MRAGGARLRPQPGGEAPVGPLPPHTHTRRGSSSLPIPATRGRRAPRSPGPTVMGDHTTGGPSSDSPQAGTLRPRRGADRSGIRGATDTPPVPSTFDPPGPRASQGLLFTLWLSCAFQRTLACVHPVPTRVCTSEAQSPHVHPPIRRARGFRESCSSATHQPSHPGPCGLAPGQGCCLQRGDVPSIAWGRMMGGLRLPCLLGLGVECGEAAGDLGTQGLTSSKDQPSWTCVLI